MPEPYKRPDRQQGMTLISWMIVIGIALFFALIGIKMVPTYLENFAIKKVLENIQHDRSVRDMSRQQIKNTLMKRFRINGVYEFDRDNIQVKKTKQGKKILIDYEVRKPIAGNVSVVMSFSESATLPQ